MLKGVLAGERSATEATNTNRRVKAATLSWGADKGDSSWCEGWGLGGGGGRGW